MADIILKTIILTIGLFALIESITLIIFPKSIRKIARDVTKNIKIIKKYAIVELIIAMIFVLIAIFLL